VRVVFLKDGSVWRTNKFMDISQCSVELNSPDMRLWERRLLYCVPVSFLHIIFPAFSVPSFILLEEHMDVLISYIHIFLMRTQKCFCVEL
jgi:hypothetical protein